MDSLSITNSQSSPKLMSIESVMPSNHLILCHPLLFLPSIFPSIGTFSNESALRIRWPNYWIFSFSIISSKVYSGLISFKTDWFDEEERYMIGKSRHFFANKVRIVKQWFFQWSCMDVRVGPKES